MLCVDEDITLYDHPLPQGSTCVSDRDLYGEREQLRPPGQPRSPRVSYTNTQTPPVVPIRASRPTDRVKTGDHRLGSREPVGGVRG